MWLCVRIFQTIFYNYVCKLLMYKDVPPLPTVKVSCLSHLCTCQHVCWDHNNFELISMLKYTMLWHLNLKTLLWLEKTCQRSSPFKSLSIWYPTQQNALLCVTQWISMNVFHCSFGGCVIVLLSPWLRVGLMNRLRVLIQTRMDH